MSSSTAMKSSSPGRERHADAYRKGPISPNSRSHTKLEKAYGHVAGDQRVRDHPFQAAVAKARELGWIS